MATIYTKDKGHGISFTVDGKRKTLTLGAGFSKKTATELKEQIETLIACRDNHQQPDKRVMAYLETAVPEIREKLESVGLITQAKIRTCGQLWDAFEVQMDVKASTKRIHAQARKAFFGFFKESDLLEKLTKGSLLSWKKHLAKRYATNTVSMYLARAKCVLAWATDEKDLFVKNPAKGIKKESFIDDEKKYHVTMTEYEKMLMACTTPEQRTILALARIGGLRVPSEVAELTWSDIRWDIGRIWIKSPKTEHHEGKKGRFVPLWESIRRELEALYFANEPDGKNDRVFRNRKATNNPRTRFEKIQIRAGIVPIQKFFTNCRASRSTEVFDRYGAICESAWIGHSQAVARRHYYMVRDEDYQTAMGEFGQPNAVTPKKLDTFLEVKTESPLFSNASD